VLASKSVDERTLYGLYVMGAVVLDQMPVLILDQELKPDGSVETPAQSNGPAPFRELPEARRAKPPSPTSGTNESIIDEIEEQMMSRDDFELFGIDEASTDADVRTAYEALIGNLRLDRMTSEQKDQQTRVRELRMRLEQAYQRVRAADTRNAFAGLRKKKRVDREERECGSRAVDAESWFRTGEGHLGHENYQQAVEAFGMAVHLDPDQGDYSAHLGYALHRSQPGNSVIRREALEHVAKGVKLAPGREKPLFFLSRIFRESGDISMAAKVLRRALATNPDSAVLVQEMCLIKAGSSKSKPRGLIDRLRRR